MLSVVACTLSAQVRYRSSSASDNAMYTPGTTSHNAFALNISPSFSSVLASPAMVRFSLRSHGISVPAHIVDQDAVVVVVPRS
jgi:hypothetical protein